MQYLDTQGNKRSQDAAIVFVEGVFFGAMVTAWCVPRAAFATAVLIGEDSDLDKRRSDLNSSSFPLIVTPGESDFGQGISTQLVAEIDTDEGWQKLSVCSDKSEEERLLQRGAADDLIVLGGDKGSDIVLVLCSPQPPWTPPTRILHGLPATHVGGLSPFLSAIGAEPVALLDSITPLIERLRAKGADCVGVLSRGGAFLWTLDLDGRLGLDRLASCRIDEDVVLPITAGLSFHSHVELGTDISHLLPRARSGELDIAFIMNQPNEADLQQIRQCQEPPAHLCRLPIPFAARW